MSIKIFPTILRFPRTPRFVRSRLPSLQRIIGQRRTIRQDLPKEKHLQRRKRKVSMILTMTRAKENQGLDQVQILILTPVVPAVQAPLILNPRNLSRNLLPNLQFQFPSSNLKFNLNLLNPNLQRKLSNLNPLTVTRILLVLRKRSKRIPKRNLKRPQQH